MEQSGEVSLRGPLKALQRNRLLQSSIVICNQRAATLLFSSRIFTLRVSFFRAFNSTAAFLLTILQLLALSNCQLRVSSEIRTLSTTTSISPARSSINSASLSSASGRVRRVSVSICLGRRDAATFR
jgi:hypothetical protein